ncbi:hypothetical protein P280DRAFT_484207 [Massarina eburnea CBS 473.64]|uniref:Uncharacterized protein n=1 Tax=Massarina eburnea CBS 473.64 TaxID=1395130 RepID=A0A6A6RKI1_9PLEO|nr:hypothetical protein P280DRAFT_484207 [Massarina eburnea CBS 473.64]
MFKNSLDRNALGVVERDIKEEDSNRVVEEDIKEDIKEDVKEDIKEDVKEDIKKDIKENINLNIKEDIKKSKRRGKGKRGVIRYVLRATTYRAKSLYVIATGKKRIQGSAG